VTIAIEAFSPDLLLELSGAPAGRNHVVGRGGRPNVVDENRPRRHRIGHVDRGSQPDSNRAVPPPFTAAIGRCRWTQEHVELEKARGLPAAAVATAPQYGEFGEFGAFWRAGLVAGGLKSVGR
jgi:hypothetical protein